MATINSVAGEYYNIGKYYACEVGDILRALFFYSTLAYQIEILVDPERLRPIDADL